jgi:hypothetical protein
VHCLAAAFPVARLLLTDDGTPADIPSRLGFPFGGLDQLGYADMARGKRLKRPKRGKASRNSRIAPADAWAATLAPTIKKLRAAGITTLQGIARELNRRGIRTSRGKKRWQAIQVRRVLERL